MKVLKRIGIGAGKVTVAAFVLWHLMVITITSLPDRSTWGWVQSVRATMLPITDPYTYTFSQWQNWGMFSQNSVSRVVIHDVEWWEPNTDTWQSLARLGYHDFPWWQNAEETSLLRNMEPEHMWPVRERYLHEICRDMELTPGTWVRMAFRFFDVPIPDVAEPPEYWETWQPEWQYSGENQWTQCPEPPTKDA